jgi:hypothetical protein
VATSAAAADAVDENNPQGGDTVKQWITVAIVGLALAVACDQADTAKPECAVVAPAAGDSLDPGSITIKAVATDDKEMKLVEFYVGNRKIGEDEAASADTFEAVWDATNDTTGGARVLKAIAFDAADNFTEALATVYMRLPPEPPPQDSTRPNVRLRAPARGDTLQRDTILLKAWATDNTMLAKVEFYVDGGKVGEDLVGVSDTFTFDWDATAATPGADLVIKATAIDTAGNTRDDTLTVHVTPYTGPTFHNSDITASETWTVMAGPHIVTAPIDIAGGARVTVEPGAIVLFDAGAGLEVGGAGSGELVAVGTQDSMITFTARATSRSDTTPGFWKGIHFRGGAGAASRLSYCNVAWGGEAGGGAVATYGGGSAAVDHCWIRASAGKGVALDDQGGCVTGFAFNRVTSCASYALETYPDLPRHFGLGNILAPNAVEGVLVHAGSVLSDLSWPAVGTPYVIEGNVVVGAPSSPVLSIGDGVMLTLMRDAGILVGTAGQPGALRAVGEETQLVIRGEAGSGEPGQWGAIVFGPDAADLLCSLTYCVIEDGGQASVASGMIQVTDALPTITRCSIGNSETWGIYLDGQEYPDPAELENNNTFYNNLLGDVRRP